MRTFVLASVSSSVFLLLARASPASAEVKQSGAAGFHVGHHLNATAAPAALYQALAQVDRWWNSQHTYSGKAQNLSLKPEAGGCFCERWSEGSVEHGRVIQTQRDRLLRLQSTLGPLLELAVSGVLTFTLAPKGPGTALEVSYRISGDASHDLGKLAPIVDRVIGEQARRLVRFADTGKPD